MKKLISKFQEKLNVSKGNAIFRVVMMSIFIACSLATIIIASINFPYRYNCPILSVVIPDGNYVIAKSITEQGIQLEENKFYDQLSLADTIFVSVMGGDGTAIFIVNKKGTSFYYKKKVMIDYFPYFYEIEKVNINNKVLSIEKVRSSSSMILGGILLPIVIFFIFLLLLFRTLFKGNGYAYDENGKFREQFLSIWD